MRAGAEAEAEAEAGVNPSRPARPWAFAGWNAQGGELPYRRLHTGVVKPRARRAWWGGGAGGPVLPAGAGSARQLNLPKLGLRWPFTGERAEALPVVVPAPVQVELEHDEVQMVQLGGSGGGGGDGSAAKEVVTILEVRERSVTEERMLFGERRDGDGERRSNGGVFNQRGGMAWRGFGHIFAVAWVRVRAAFGDG